MRPVIHASALPQAALLQRYAANGHDYTDCFCAQVSRDATLDQFVTAFYTTWLFRLERLILRITVSLPSSDQDIATMLAGADRFAAWTVEARAPDQILMCDVAGATRSWFMVQRHADKTRLCFGSAVIANKDAKLGLGFRIFLPLHRLYARALLACAVSRMRG